VRIKPQQRPPLDNALMNLVQEPRIAILVGHRLPGPPVAAAVPLPIDHGRLPRLLRPLPGLPRFPLNPLQLLQLEVAGRIKVPNPLSWEVVC
jgi:hypothetical protein